MADKSDPKWDAAIRALEAFWGRSNGGDEAYARLRDQLSQLRLRPKDLAALKANLTIPATEGTTAAKIRRAGQCLDQLGAA